MDKYMSLFKLNDKIELTSRDDRKTLGFIYDIKDKKLYISISADDESFKLLEVGEGVYGAIYSREEVIGFDANITARAFRNNSVYEVSDMRNFTKVQRRENIRVRHSMKVLYTDNNFLTKLNFQSGREKETLEKIGRYLKEGHMVDLSAGGMKLSTKEDFGSGEVLILVLNLNGRDIIVKGKIVHKEVNLVPKRTVYSYGIKFIDIEEVQQERIISYLFVIMRKNRIK